MAESITITNLIKAFGSKVVLNGISIEAKPGEFIVLVGPSGCGKSTLLRAVAGLETVDGGTIAIGNRDVTLLAPKDRDIAMVFQDYALYPHKTVYENIAFGLRVRGVDKRTIDARVQEAAAKLDLIPYLGRRPAALSGGQRQRVAIGRAIVRKPRAFLFDEPLSNLDAKLRGSMRISIAKLHKELGATILYVTHDQVEAMTLADRILVLEGGRIQQSGAPLDLYYHPSNVFVGTFIGSPTMNLLEGRLEDRDGTLTFVSDKGLVHAVPKAFVEALRETASSSVIWGLRPENLQVAEGLPSNSVLSGKVVVSEPLGPTSTVIFDINGHEVQVSVPAPFRPGRGEVVPLVLSSKHLYMFDRSSRLAMI